MTIYITFRADKKAERGGGGEAATVVGWISSP
jgi:hypothetical protein